jgi:hypothetical protein
MTASDLHTRAMLVKLSISAWSARKYDRKITQETNEAHGATADAGRYNKHLMPSDAPTYKALNAHISALRLTHYAQSLAWSDEGWRLLPVKNYQSYQDAIRAGQHTFNQLLSEFLADYPALKDEARRRLNGMYSEDDYPANLASKFSFAVEFAPVPSGSDYRVTLSQEEIEIIAARTDERAKQAFADAQADACKRLYDAVAKIHERLAQPEAIFRDSLIDNARELCGVLSRLNLADDPKLEELRRETELLASTAPQTLRDLPHVRTDTATRAQSILDAMKATYGSAVIA